MKKKKEEKLTLITPEFLKSWWPPAELEFSQKRVT
jgi:hypothetical protein